MADSSTSTAPPSTAASRPSPAPSQPARCASLGDMALPRRQSTQERISEILQTARERADSMSAPGRNASFPAADPSRDRDRDQPAADETTGIMMRRNHRSYQATDTSAEARQRRPASRRPETAHAHAEGEAEGEVTEEKHSFWEHFSTLWAIELENKGSTARDHLALERTFLAWLRTSLAFASIGIAITQLFRLNTSITDGDPHLQTVRRLGKPLGATFLGISIVVLFMGHQRYTQSQHWLMRGKFPASRGQIILISCITFALMLVSLVVVIVVQPTMTPG